MARLNAISLVGTKFGLLRTVTASPLAAENPTLSDANYPVAQGFDATGYDTVFFGVEIDGGSSPTVTLELLFRDEDAADGFRWKRLKFGALEGVVSAGTAPANQDSGALSSGADLVELVTLGRSLILPRIKAVANPTSTTVCRIIAIPGIVRPAKALSHGS